MTSERERRELDAAIRRVVQRNACIGCGLCTRLDTSLRMELEPDGFLRPHRTGVDGVVADDAARRFEQACPGCRVAAVRPRGSRRHPTMGSYFGVWEAWASDDAVRWRGSSGGALTALHAWLLDSGRSSRIASATMGREPRRTVPVTITTKAEALAAAGSRYAPVGVLAEPDLTSCEAITAKPCEISAIRALGTSARSDDARAGSAATGSGTEPILLSFFCAGTPSQHATGELLARARGRAGRRHRRPLVPRPRMARPLHGAPCRRRRIAELRGVMGRRARAGDALALQGVRRRRGRVRRRRGGGLLAGGRARVSGVHRGTRIERAHRPHRTRPGRRARRRGRRSDSSSVRSA